MGLAGVLGFLVEELIAPLFGVHGFLHGQPIRRDALQRHLHEVELLGCRGRTGAGPKEELRDLVVDVACLGHGLVEAEFQGEGPGFAGEGNGDGHGRGHVGDGVVVPHDYRRGRALES